MVGRGGTGDNQWSGFAGSCSGTTTAAALSLQCSVMDGFYSPALLTFELEVHIYCCFHFAEDVQAQIRARLSQPDSQFLADDL